MTGQLIQAQKGAISEMILGEEGPRARVVHSLLAASLDHAESATLLLAANPATYGVSAFALFRPQLESFCRAVMFSLSSEVSDDEVRAFIAKDTLPQRVPAGGKKKGDIRFDAISNITMREMNAIGEQMDGTKETFKRFVLFAMKDLHGFVHGGSVLYRMYTDGGNGVGFDLSHETARQLLSHIGRLGQVAYMFLGIRMARGGDLTAAPMRAAWPPFCRHVARAPRAAAMMDAAPH